MKEGQPSNQNWFQRKIEEYKNDFRKTYLSVPPRKVMRNIGLIIMGNILLAFTTSFFLVPGKIVTGGNSGIALIIMKIIEVATGGNQPAWLDTDFIILLCTIFFFILAFILLGFSAAIKNTVGAIVYPTFVYIFTIIRNIEPLHVLRIEEYMNSFENHIQNTGYDPATVTLISGLIAGVLMGFATSLAFKGEGSAGGTTCLVVFFSKHTTLKANTVSIIIDSIIIISGMFTYQNILNGIIGILAALFSAYVIEKVFVGGNQALHAEIVSKRWKEISDAIHNEMHRGTTIYTAQGGYTGTERKVVYVSFSRQEYNRFMDIVTTEDPGAFVTITSIYDVSGGYGFAKKDLIVHHREKTSSTNTNKEENEHDKDDTQS